MSNVCPLVVLIVAAGSGERAKPHTGDCPKQYAYLGKKPLLAWSLEAFLAYPFITYIQVVYDPAHEAFYREALQSVQNLPKAEIILPPVPGGETRQNSVYSGLLALQKTLSDQSPAVLIHDAARPFLSQDLITRAHAALNTGIYGAIPTIPIADTVKRLTSKRMVYETVSRDDLFLSQTPQIFWLNSLLELHKNAANDGPFTDDSALVEYFGKPMGTFLGSADNIKMTTCDDFIRLSPSCSRVTKVAMGFDIHAFTSGDHIWLGGVKIPHTHGISAHSDGDVLLHAVTDSLFGLLGEDDIGVHFPPSDPQWRGASSSHFLAHALDKLHIRGGTLVHMDITLIAQRPKLSEHRHTIRDHLSALLQLPPSSLGLKATTAEQLGSLGRAEGIAVYATATALLPWESS
jgi:2-C-methyl-D-erythritol 4-phosphate cytidylyltransferase/2-C-methyl-D-erythritol 2,4-cyclodiphosphate synthase